MELVVRWNKLQERFKTFYDKNPIFFTVLFLM